MTQRPYLSTRKEGTHHEPYSCSGGDGIGLKGEKHFLEKGSPEQIYLSYGFTRLYLFYYFQIYPYGWTRYRVSRLSTLQRFFGKRVGWAGTLSSVIYRPWVLADL